MIVFLRHHLHLFIKYFEPGNRTLMKLPLRRTLVLSECSASLRGTKQSALKSSNSLNFITQIASPASQLTHDVIQYKSAPPCGINCARVLHRITSARPKKILLYQMYYLFECIAIFYSIIFALLI